MNKSIKKKWVAALRSNAYKQGRHFLRTDDDNEQLFCCLGVLCDLHAQECGLKWEKADTERFFFYLGHSGLLPQKVANWAETPCVPIINDISLAYINDDGASFAEIANLVERHL